MHFTHTHGLVTVVLVLCAGCCWGLSPDQIPNRIGAIWTLTLQGADVPDLVRVLQPLLAYFDPDIDFAFLSRGRTYSTRPAPPSLREFVRQRFLTESVDEWRLAAVLMILYPTISEADSAHLLRRLFDRTLPAKATQFAGSYWRILDQVSDQTMTVTDCAALHQFYNEIVASGRLQDCSDLLRTWRRLVQMSSLEVVKPVAQRASMLLTPLQWSVAFFDTTASLITTSIWPSRTKTVAKLRHAVRSLLAPEFDPLRLDQYVRDVVIEFGLRMSIPDKTWVNVMLQLDRTWPHLTTSATGTGAGRELRQLFRYWFGLGRIRNRRILEHMSANRLRSFIRILIESFRNARIFGAEWDDSHLAFGKLFYDLLHVRNGPDLITDLGLYDTGRHPMNLARHMAGVAVCLSQWILHMSDYSSVTTGFGPRLKLAESLYILLRISLLPQQPHSHPDMRRACYNLVSGSLVTLSDRWGLLPLVIIRDRRWQALPLHIEQLAQVSHWPMTQAVFEWADLLWALLNAPNFIAQLRGSGQTPSSHIDLLVWIYVRLTVQQQRTICARFPQYRYAIVPHYMEPVVLDVNDTSLIPKINGAGKQCRICNGPLIPTDSVNMREVRQRLDTLPIVEFHCGHYLHTSCAGRLRLQTPSHSSIRCPICLYEVVPAQVIDYL